MLAQKYFFFWAAGRQPASETPIFIFFFEVKLSDLCRWRTLTPLPDAAATDKLNGERLVSAAPVDCADGGGALIICHLSVWLLGLGLSIIVIITFN